MPMQRRPSAVFHMSKPSLLNPKNAHVDADELLQDGKWNDVESMALVEQMTAGLYVFSPVF
jgi:hypothetical protein